MTDQLARPIVLAYVASTLVLVGLIWFVQVVHCPRFAQVGKDYFADFPAAHVRSTTWVVGLPMLVGAVTSVVLAGSPPSQELAIACWIGLALVVAIWLSTVLFQVPKQHALRDGFDSSRPGRPRTVNLPRRWVKFFGGRPCFPCRVSWLAWPLARWPMSCSWPACESPAGAAGFPLSVSLRTSGKRVASFAGQGLAEPYGQPTRFLSSHDQLFEVGADR